MQATSNPTIELQATCQGTEGDKREGSVMRRDAPIACSLGTEGYKRRLKTIEELGAMAMLEVEERPENVTIWLRNTVDLKERLLAFVEVERECCPFLALRVDEVRGRLALTISARQEAEAVVADIVRSFKARRGP
jgi:hypothetical protein